MADKSCVVVVLAAPKFNIDLWLSHENRKAYLNAKLNHETQTQRLSRFETLKICITIKIYS